MQSHIRGMYASAAQSDTWYSTMCTCLLRHVSAAHLNLQLLAQQSSARGVPMDAAQARASPLSNF